jgi:hypothetical protein
MGGDSYVWAKGLEWRNTHRTVGLKRKGAGGLYDLIGKVAMSFVLTHTHMGMNEGVCDELE